jgi:squalene synthase HpnC
VTGDIPRARGASATGAARSQAATIMDQAGAKASAENFPVALALLPGRYRRHLAAIYGFARSADDMGDQAPPPQRLALLDELEADLLRLYQPGPAGVTGEREAPRLAVIQALAPAIAQCAIPAQPFLDLIQANRQDQSVTRYQTFGDLLGYCRLSADPVGRMVLHVFGAATPRRQELSDLVCTALQLAEHWQDVAEDYASGRVYLPREDMDRFGCTEGDLAARSAGRELRALMEFEVARASQMLDAGAPIVGTLRGAARVAVAGYVAGGRAALAAIAASGYDVLTVTPRPRRRRVATGLLHAFARGR